MDLSDLILPGGLIASVALVFGFIKLIDRASPPPRPFVPSGPVVIRKYATAEAFTAEAATLAGWGYRVAAYQQAT